MEISEMGVFKQVEAIEAWQANPNIHPLTCGQCNPHVNLVAEIIPTSNIIVMSSQEGSKITLTCPKCDYVQDNVPDIVYNWYIYTHLNHKIPLGQVVELEITEDCSPDEIFYGKDYKFSEDRKYMKPDEGVEGDKEIVLRFVGNLRALVVGYTRDCDGTPLYCLSNLRVKYNSGDLPDNIRGRLDETIRYRKWAKYLQTGWSEDSLKVIEGQFVPLLYNSIYEYEENLV
jgi:hypothetical protein